MKLTKETLIKIIKEEYDAYSIESVRERAHTGEMANQVWQIMSSMGASEDEPIFSARDTFDMIYEAANEEDPSDFWWGMLNPDGHLGDAIKGLRQTKDDDYDRAMEESKREELLKNIKEEAEKQLDRELKPEEALDAADHAMEIVASLKDLITDELVNEELAAVLAESGATFGTELSRGLSKKGINRLPPQKAGTFQRLGMELANEMEDLSPEEKKEIISMMAQLAGLTGLNPKAKHRDPSSLEENWGRDPFKPRKKSYAWHQDGGANDEGYSHKPCYKGCGGRRTEHDMGQCLRCIDRNAARAQQARERNQPLLDAIAAFKRMAEEEKFQIPPFLQDIEGQLKQGRNLSQRQRIVVMQILRSRGIDTAGPE